MEGKQDDGTQARLRYRRGAKQFVNAAFYTGLLTVWRKLHVEVDSMGAEYDAGNSTALTDTVLTDTTKHWPVDRFHKYGEDWDLNPNIGQAEDFDVVANENTGISVSEGSEMLQVAQADDPYKVEFVGFDADDTLRDEIPDPSTSALADAFDDCYIVPVLDTSKDQPHCAWHYNFGNNFRQNWLPFTQAKRGTAQDQEYWTVHIMGQYEVFDESKDNDHPDDSALGRVSVTYWYWEDPGDEPPMVSAVFEEVIRDLAAQHGWTSQQREHVRGAVVLHEIGLQFRLPEYDSGPWDNVMRIPKSDAEEDNLKNRPNVFNDECKHLVRNRPVPW